jgi:hypothetical protein
MMQSLSIVIFYVAMKFIIFFRCVHVLLTLVSLIYVFCIIVMREMAVQTLHERVDSYLANRHGTQDSIASWSPPAAHKSSIWDNNALKKNLNLNLWTNDDISRMEKSHVLFNTYVLAVWEDPSTYYKVKNFDLRTLKPGLIMTAIWQEPVYTVIAFHGYLLALNTLLFLITPFTGVWSLTSTHIEDLNTILFMGAFIHVLDLYYVYDPLFRIEYTFGAAYFLCTMTLRMIQHVIDCKIEYAHHAHQPRRRLYLFVLLMVNLVNGIGMTIICLRYTTFKKETLLLMLTENIAIIVASIGSVFSYACLSCPINFKCAQHGKNMLMDVFRATRVHLVYTFISLVTHYKLILDVLCIYIVCKIGCALYHAWNVCKWMNVTGSFDDRYPIATKEEVDAVNDNCMICRDSLTGSLRKLPCTRHYLHATCLVQSAVHGHFKCPVCR